MLPRSIKFVWLAITMLYLRDEKSQCMQRLIEIRGKLNWLRFSIRKWKIFLAVSQRFITFRSSPSNWLSSSASSSSSRHARAYVWTRREKPTHQKLSNISSKITFSLAVFTHRSILYDYNNNFRARSLASFFTLHAMKTCNQLILREKTTDRGSRTIPEFHTIRVVNNEYSRWCQLVNSFPRLWCTWCSLMKNQKCVFFPFFLFFYVGCTMVLCARISIGKDAFMCRNKSMIWFLTARNFDMM